MNKRDTSWDPQSNWYDKIVGDEGSYYHKELIIPELLKVLGDVSSLRILDLGCGQGIFSRILKKKNAIVYGIDLSKKLIQKAKQYPDSEGIHFYTLNAENMSIFQNEFFDRVISILSIGNIRRIDLVFKEVYRILKYQGLFYIVTIHPCFRIPRQSHWGYDELNKIMYRRVDRYAISMEIPIITHPGKTKSIIKDQDYSLMFHRSLGEIFSYFNKSQFLIKNVEEWYSPKKSEGKRAKEENRARKEIPLFIMFEAIKLI